MSLSAPCSPVLNVVRFRYETYYARFKSIFKLPHSPLPVYYIPGNHDTGYVYSFFPNNSYPFLTPSTQNKQYRLGISASFSSHATTRYISHFGPLNNRISISNHTLLFIDAPALVEEDQQRQQHNYDQWAAIPGGPVDYVKRHIIGGYYRSKFVSNESICVR